MELFNREYFEIGSYGKQDFRIIERNYKNLLDKCFKYFPKISRKDRIKILDFGCAFYSLNLFSRIIVAMNLFLLILYLLTPWILRYLFKYLTLRKEKYLIFTSFSISLLGIASNPSTIVISFTTIVWTILTFKFKSKNQAGLENDKIDWVTDVSCKTIGKRRHPRKKSCCWERDKKRCD